MQGLSLSFCIRDMLNKKVDPASVTQIVCSCRPNLDGSSFDQTSWDYIIESYQRNYWYDFPEEAAALANRFLAEGKIDFPSLRGEAIPYIAEGHWVTTLLDLLVLIARLHTTVTYYFATCFKKDAIDADGIRCSSNSWWRYRDIFCWFERWFYSIGERYEIYVLEVTHNDPTTQDIASIVTTLVSQNIEFQMSVTATKTSIYKLTPTNLDLVYYCRKAGWTVHKAEHHNYRCFGKTTVLPPYC